MDNQAAEPSKAVDIIPGNMVEYLCPEGQLVKDLKAGQFLPQTDDPSFYVVSIVRNKITLGPIKAGEYLGQIDCSDDSSVEVHTMLRPTPPNNLPQHEAPLMPYTLHFPTWLFVSIASVFILSALSLFIFYRKRKKAREIEALKRPDKIRLPDEAFDDYLKIMFFDKSFEKSTGEDLWTHYALATSHLRKFLEMRLDFHAHFATSKEFVGKFNEALLKNRIKNSQYEGILLAVLSQADQIRFSKSNSDAGARKQFLKHLEDLKKAFPQPNPIENDVRGQA